MVIYLLTVYGAFIVSGQSNLLLVEESQQQQWQWNGWLVKSILGLFV